MTPRMKAFIEIGEVITEGVNRLARDHFHPITPEQAERLSRKHHNLPPYDRDTANALKSPLNKEPGQGG